MGGFFLFMESSNFLVIFLSNESRGVSSSGEKVLRHLIFLASIDLRLIILMDLDDLVDSENHISRFFLDHINVEDIPVVSSAINGC